MLLDPASLSIEDRYKILIGSVVPRPIALVSTISPGGVHNLAPFSFFAGVGSNPMSLLFCPANTPAGDEKDTLRNCKPVSDGGTGEFVVNAVSHGFVAPTAACAEALAYEASEFELSGLTPAPMPGVAPPRVAQSLVSFACKTSQVIRTNPGAPSGGNIVLGLVVAIFADDRVIDTACRIDPVRLDAVGRMAGLTYCTTRQRFEVPWGSAALRSERG